MCAGTTGPQVARTSAGAADAADTMRHEMRVTCVRRVRLVVQVSSDDASVTTSVPPCRRWSIGCAVQGM